MKKKVLVVDDEKEQLEFASAILEEEGYIALSALDGVQGMKLVKEKNPDLILLDIMMPKKGGVGMYKDLKRDEMTKGIPVVVVTGVTRGGEFNEQMLTQDEELPGPDGYVEKPMNPNALIKIIKDLLS